MIRELTRSAGGPAASADEGWLTVEFRSGPPIAVAQRRLGELKGGVIVFVPVFLQDGDWRFFVPRDAVQLLATASAAPVAFVT